MLVYATRIGGREDPDDDHGGRQHQDPSGSQGELREPAWAPLQ